LIAGYKLTLTQVFIKTLILLYREYVLRYIITFYSIVTTMEHLSDEQRKAISKLTAVRLAAKLTQIGVSENEIEGMNKDAMMQAWALAVYEGRDKPAATMVAEVKPEAVQVRYGSDLERQRLEFEMRKWEEERKEREAERIRQERKEEAERREREEWRREKLRVAEEQKHYE
jgi:hypothetical protein